jgi:alpha-1,2-mannosyltransferase
MSNPDFQWTLPIFLKVLSTVLSSLAGVLIFLAFLTRFNQWLKMRSNKSKILGFFHPNCDAGAGGEKVLWSAVAAVQRAGALSKKDKPV